MKSYLPIVYCFDSNYASYAATSMLSLYENTATPVKIYCLIPSSETGKIIPIMTLIKGKGIDIQVMGVDESLMQTWKTTHHLNWACYLRLLIPEIIEEKKVIYLDSDTLVLKDLSGLYAIDTESNGFAGVKDSGGASTSKVARVKDDIYINSGVLLINIPVLKEDNFFNKCEIIYKEHYESITWLDQCIINKYAEKKKTIIDPKWNRQIFPNDLKSYEFDNLLANNTNIIHFLGGIKPWNEWCNPYISDYWWSYAKRLNIENFHPIRITTIGEALELVRVLDLNEHYKRSGEIKNLIINALTSSSK